MNTYNFIGLGKDGTEFQVEINAPSEEAAWKIIHELYTQEANIQNNKMIKQFVYSISHNDTICYGRSIKLYYRGNCGISPVSTIFLSWKDNNGSIC